MIRNTMSIFTLFAMLFLSFLAGPVFGDECEPEHTPRLEGSRVSWCLTRGGGCGQEAADAYCRKIKCKSATFYDVDREFFFDRGGDEHISGTYLIDEDRYCRDSEDEKCYPFSYVECD